MPDQNDQASQALERRYKVRQVTHIQASWTERERGEAGGGERTQEMAAIHGVTPVFVWA